MFSVQTCCHIFISDLYSSNTTYPLCLIITLHCIGNQKTAGSGTDLALEHTSPQSCALQQPLLASVQATQLPDQTPLLPLHPCLCCCLLCREGTLWWYVQPGRDLAALEPQRCPPLDLPAALVPSVLCQRCRPMPGVEQPS